MKTPILILLASIATTFAQVAPPKAAKDPLIAEPEVGLAPDIAANLDSRITNAKKRLTEIRAQLDAAKAQLKLLVANAEHGGAADPAKQVEIVRAIDALTKSEELLKTDLVWLESQQNSATNPLTPRAKPVEPPRAGRNKKPDPAASDPFVKPGTGTLTGENTYTGPAPVTAEPTEGRPTNYQVLFETFDLSRGDFLALLDEKGDDDARYRRVAEWMTAGKAKLTTFTTVTTGLGQQTKAESIDEVRYPTEFSLPHSADDIASPAQFETKNAGESFEIEVSSDDEGQTVEASVAPRSVTLLKFEDRLADATKPNSAVSQPVFNSRSLVTNVALPLNHPRQIGTLSGVSDGGAIPAEVRIAFLTVRRAILPKPKPEALVKEAPQTRLEYSFFSLDRGAARDLCLAKPEPQACYDGIRVLVGEKKAQLEHLSTSVTKFGMRTQTEETQEVTYATQWEPGSAPKVPQTKPQDAAKAHDAKDGETPKPQPNPTAVEGARFPMFATAFETRNTGFTSQAEPQLTDDGATVDLNLDLQFTRHAGPLEVTGVAKKYPTQPLFQTSQLTTTLKTTVGQQQLIGTFNTPAESGVNGRKDDGRVWFGFVRAVLVK